MDAMTGLTSTIQQENNAPIKASQASANTASTSESAKAGVAKPPAGDTVTISEEARQKSAELSEAAAQKKTDEVAIDPEGPEAFWYDFSDPVHLTTSSGTKVSIYKYAPDSPDSEENQERPSEYFMASITRQDGKSYTFQLTGDTRITEQDGQIRIDDGTSAGRQRVMDESGTVRWEENASASSEAEDAPGTLQGTAQDDILINFDSSVVDGGEGNDTIVDMGYKIRQEREIRGGAGDDRMIVGTLHQSHIDGGEGNDTISIDVLDEGEVSGGSGDDHIEIRNSGESTVSGGAGEDHIKIQNSHRSTVSGGDGDDHIETRVSAESTVSGGDGDDVINVETQFGGSVAGGDGNDTINVVTNYEATIDGGEGNDNINLGLGNGIQTTHTAHAFVDGEWRNITGKTLMSQVYGGGGNDRISVFDARQSIFDGGDGDDVMTITGNRNAVFGGAGHNKLTVAGKNNLLLSALSYNNDPNILKELLKPIEGEE